MYKPYLDEVYKDNQYPTSIHSLRTHMGLSQEEFAKRCHVSFNRIKRYDRSELRLTPEDKSKIEYYTDEDIEVYYKETEYNFNFDEAPKDSPITEFTNQFGTFKVGDTVGIFYRNNILQGIGIITDLDIYSEDQGVIYVKCEYSYSTNDNELWEYGEVDEYGLDEIRPLNYVPQVLNNKINELQSQIDLYNKALNYCKGEE